LFISSITSGQDSTYFEGELIYKKTFSQDTSKGAMQTKRFVSPYDSIKITIKGANCILQPYFKINVTKNIFRYDLCKIFILENGSKEINIIEIPLTVDTSSWKFKISKNLDTTIKPLGNHQSKVSYSKGFINENTTYDSTLPKIKLKFIPFIGDESICLNENEQSIIPLEYSLEVGGFFTKKILIRINKKIIDNTTFRIPGYKINKKNIRKNKDLYLKTYQLKKKFKL
jgi:hypothetical protein